MTDHPITSGRAVRDLVADGWELWHVSPDALPGRWELRRRAETRRVSWDAVAIIRTHYLDWFERNTEARQEGRYTWASVPRQRALGLAHQPHADRGRTTA